MSLIDKLFEKTIWEKFYDYKTGLRCSKRFSKELRAFIDAEAYLKYEDLSSKIDKYIKEHLSEDLSSKVLCDEFGVGKTYLYQL